MRVWASVTLLAAAVAAASAQSSTTSKFEVIQCYKQDITTWMPNTLHNLIALIEKFESKNTYTTMDELAEMLLTRYRKDGIVYRPGSGASDWTMDETTKANKKQALIELISRPTTQPPVDTFDIREECALHRMLSHSTDDYPIAGIDEIWNTPVVPASSGRVKRSTSNSSPSGPVASMAEPLRAASLYEAAVHPVERGVIETPYGPVAGGTLLAGLMSISNNPSFTIQNVLAADSDYMPSEMKTRTLIPIYAATLAGDLGELALWTRHSSVVGSPTVGPLGRFHNCTTCSKQFSLKTNAVSFLSRAEIFAGLDALILTAAYSKSGVSGSNSLKLSQLLNLYYSEKGLPGMPEYKACNRLNLYQSLPEKSRLTEQALNFMYAYTKDFADQKYYIEQNVNSYLTIEQAFTTTITQAVQAMESFIGSYNYDDEGASRCYFSSGENSWSTGATSRVPQSEGSADLLAVYAEEGTTEYMEKERQMIADVARRLGVSTRRSRLGVLRAKDATWIQSLQNISNVADWGCNFTIGTLYQSGSSGNRGDIFTVVLEALTKFYNEQNHLAFADLATSSGRSQVVMWQVPAAMPGDLETNKAAIKAFRLRFPDVSIIFVGRNEGPYQELLDDSDDFISYSNKNLKTLTDETVNRIQMSPRFFMYPACDPNNSTITNYNEDSHKYEGAVTPNVTTYLRIPPQTFHYSEELTLKVQGKVRACFSRTNRLALQDFAVENLDTERDKLTDDTVQCTGGPNDNLDEVTYKWLCDRYIKTCNPVYVSVTGLDTAGARVSCNSDTDPECDFPNQIQYTLTHKGMICGASCTAPALLLLLLPALLQYFLH